MIRLVGTLTRLGRHRTVLWFAGIAFFVLGTVRAGRAQGPFTSPPRSYGYGLLEVMAHTPDERQLVTLGSHGVHLFDAGSLADVGHLVRPTYPYTPTQPNNYGFSPDSRLLAVAYHDTTVGVWDLQERSLAAVLRGHGDWVTALAFSDDGRRLGTGDRAGGMKVWDTDTWELVAEHRQEYVRAMAFPSADRLITSNGYRAIRVWRLPGFSQKLLLVHEDNVEDLIVAPDGRRLVSAADDGTVRVWNLENGDNLGILETPGLLGTSNLRMSPDGRFIAVNADASMYSGLHVWSLDSLEEIGAFAQPDNGLVGFSADSRYLLILGWRDQASRFVLKFWDLAYRDFADSLAVGSGGWHAFARDSMRVTVFRRDQSEMETFDLLNGTTRNRRAVSPRSVSQVTFSPGGEWIAAVGAYAVHLWETASGRWLASLSPDERVRGVAFTPDCRDLIVATASGVSRRPVTALQVEERLWEGYIPSAVFSPQASLVALEQPDDNVVLFPYDATGEPVVVGVHPGDPEKMALAAAGHRLAVSGQWWDDPGVWLWDTGAGIVEARIPLGTNAYALGFSPDGGTLALAGWRSGLYLWGVEPLAQIHSIGTNSSIHALAFSPDGGWLACAEPGAGPLWLFDRETGSQVQAPASVYPVHSRALAYSQDGRYLALGGGGTVLVWSDDNKPPPASSPCSSLDPPWSTAVAQSRTVLPRSTHLAAPYPNPFNGSTTLTFKLPAAAQIQLEVYDLLGQQVATLARHRFAPGEHALTWDATGADGAQMASGVYLFRLQTDRTVRIRKALLLR